MESGIVSSSQFALPLVVGQILLFRLGATAGPHTGRFAVANLSSSASFFKSTGGQATHGTRKVTFEGPLMPIVSRLDETR